MITLGNLIILITCVPSDVCNLYDQFTYGTDLVNVKCVNGYVFYHKPIFISKLHFKMIICQYI